jgi:very-short-patch-repair endonuclease
MITKEYLIKEYSDKQRSTYDIAKECNTYPNKILRALRKYNIHIRDKSEAQTTALETGRHKHPTKGQKRPENIRNKISVAVANSWKKLSETEKQNRIETAKQQWIAMSEKQKENLRKLAANAVRKAAEEGSKLEKFLLIELQRREYTVIFHKSHMISKEDLQVDLYLPDLKTAIEVDGPSHFYPIWGEANLARHLTADHTKTGLLLAAGYVLIRVKNLAKNNSKFQYYNLLTNLLHRLELIEIAFPPESERLIEIEVL